MPRVNLRIGVDDLIKLMLRTNEISTQETPAAEGICAPGNRSDVILTSRVKDA